MITIKVKKLKSRKNDLSDSVTVEISNMAAEGFMKKIEGRVKNLKCDLHPGRNSTLLILADKKKLIRVDKKGFCCQQFADQVKINVD